MHPMVDEKPAKPADAEISPYLQQPLRTLKTARQDQKRRQREATDVLAKTTKQPD
jgi:hypothetical protein